MNSINSVRSMWDGSAKAWAETLDGTEGRYFRERALATAEIIARNRSGGVYLDYGCGDGFLAAEMARRGFDSYGCDLSSAMIAIARKEVETRGISNMRFAVNKEDEVPFGRRFDIISVIGVFPYLRNFENFVLNLKAHLVPGGMVVATCTNRLSLFTAKALWMNLFAFRFSNWKAWLGTNYSLVRTGIWSGGGVGWRELGSVERCYDAASFDDMFRRAGYHKVDEVDFFRIARLDRSPQRRGAISRRFARRLGWNHLACYNLNRANK